MGAIRKMSGDGLAFYLACKESGKDDPEIYNAMDIGNTTYYQLFKKAEINDKYRRKASAALGRTVEDIFGTGKKDVKYHSPPTSHQESDVFITHMLKTNEALMEILKTIPSTQQTIVESQQLIVALMQQMQSENKDVMKKLYDSVNAQRAALTSLSSHLNTGVEIGNQIKRYVQANSILARKYYAQKEGSRFEEIDKEFDYIFREIGNKDNVKQDAHNRGE